MLYFLFYPNYLSLLGNYANYTIYDASTPAIMCKCGGASEHEHLSPVTVTKSLHSFIVKERSSVLNAKNPWILHERVLREKYIENGPEQEGIISECDDQLLINILFTGTVKVKGIEIFGSKSCPDKWPTKMKVFVNTPNVDFTNIDTIPLAQEFQLKLEDNSLPLRYSTRAAKFFNVNTLTILIEGASSGGKIIEVDYLGFEGEFSQNRVGAVKAEYEVKPMLIDHKSLEQIRSSIN